MRARGASILAVLLALLGGLGVVAAVAVDFVTGGAPGMGTVQLAALGVGLALLIAAQGLARRTAGGLGVADVPWIVGAAAFLVGSGLLVLGRDTAPPPPPDLSLNPRLLSVERSVRPPGRGTARCLPIRDRRFPPLRLEPVVAGLQKPVYAMPAGDGSGRLFVVEKGGRIRIARNGRVADRPFLDIHERVVSDERPPASWEQGLLSVAFPPDFSIAGRFYVHYTAVPDGEIRVSRFRVSGDPDRADPASEEVLLAISSVGPIHNGGQLAFGPDGMLYVGVGDGGGYMWPHGDPDDYGSGAVEHRRAEHDPIIPPEYTEADIVRDDPWNMAQDLSTLLGAILRLDVSADSGYSIPPDNPFAGDEERPGRSTRGEIWAYGLRNPWRFSFDACDGALFAGDVGRSSYEEVDLVVKGGNYGWDVMEGGHCSPPWEPQDCSSAGFEYPIVAYGHLQIDPAGGNAVMGGYVYRGTRIPALVGRYVFGDFISSRVWALTPEGARSPIWHMDELMKLEFLPSSFGLDADGELLIIDYGGTVYRLVADRGAG